MASVVLALVAVLTTIYGLKQTAEHGIGRIRAAFLVAGVVVGAVFVRRQGRLAYPLLNLKLFGRSRFSAAIAAYGLSSLAMFGVYLFIAQYLQLVLGLSPFQAWRDRPAGGRRAAAVLLVGLGISGGGAGDAIVIRKPATRKP